MGSTSRLAWILGFTVMTIGYVWVILHGYDYVQATLVYGAVAAGCKGWEKFLWYRYGQLLPQAVVSTITSVPGNTVS